ncbi:MAG: hypothetical protein KY468_07040 [Armatimonadetes bacterium]|nr:hypothetical protein [Armatimonadota bacterium]
MPEWKLMFGGVQALTRSMPSMEEGIRQTVAFAREYPEEFDDPKFWDRVEDHIHRLPYDTVSAWAHEGLEALEPAEGWEVLFLDLGDAPETFFLYGKDFASFDEPSLRDLILSLTVVEYTHFEDHLLSRGADPDQTLYRRPPVERVYHNVYELGDRLLSWNEGSMDYNGSNGYLLWLAFGSFALLEPLREQEYCRRILKNRNKLYLLSGFEQIFFYLGTVTPEGLRFEETAPVSLDALRKDWKRQEEETGLQLSIWQENSLED